MKRWLEPRVGNARDACLAQLSKAYERFAENEQIATHEKDHEAATIAHGYCVILLRAMIAEDVNPVPKGLG